MNELQIKIPWPDWTAVRYLGGGSTGHTYEIQRTGENGETESAAMRIHRIPAQPSITQAMREKGLSDDQIRTRYRSELSSLTRRYHLMAGFGDTPGMIRCQELCTRPQYDGLGWLVYTRTELLEPLEGPLTQEQVLETGMALCRIQSTLRKKTQTRWDMSKLMLSRDGSCRLRDLAPAPKNGEFTAPNEGSPACGDVYALGMVLYKLLNRGRGPFLPLPPQEPDSRQLTEAREYRQLGEPLPAPADGSPELAAVVLKACAPHPEDRYPTPEALLSALNALTGPAAGKHKRKAGAEEKPPKKPRKIGKLLAVCLAAALLIAAALLLIPRQTPQELPPAEETLPTVIPTYPEDLQTVETGPEPTRSLSETAPATEAAAATEDVKATTAAETVPPAEVPDADPFAALEASPMSRSVIGAGKFHTAILYPDGSAIAFGQNDEGQCDVWEWKDLTALRAGDLHTVGLRSDGTVVAAGSNRYHQCDTGEWENVVDIAAGEYHTVAVTADGGVYAAGLNNADQSRESALRLALGERKAVQAACGYEHTVLLCSDGTAAAVGSNQQGQCDVEGWEDLVAVYAGTSHTLGLQSDGTVLSTGNNDYDQCNIYRWKDVVSLSAGDFFTLGVTADGRVLSCGRNQEGQLEDLDQWTDVVAIGGGSGHIAAIRRDGSILYAGLPDAGQKDLDGYTYP